MIEARGYQSRAFFVVYVIALKMSFCQPASVVCVKVAERFEWHGV